LKRTLATALAAAVAGPVVLTSTILGASSAQAAPLNCDSVYPPGQPYKITASPNYVSVKKGAQVVLFANLSRGGVGCKGERVEFYSKNTSQSSFSFLTFSTTKANSKGQGIAARQVKANRTFNWFATSHGVNSTTKLVDVHP
jgi:uncharacterized cupredoxin-like copper-binding protein